MNRPLRFWMVVVCSVFVPVAAQAQALASITGIVKDTSGAVLRFIESRFDEERTRGEIRQLFGDVRDTTFTPMTLRSIFLAMAKAGRASA